MHAREHDGDATEDAALAHRIASGDRDAERALCERLYPRVRAYGLCHARDASVASDLAQHVVMVVIEALRAGKVEDVSRLAAFAMGACKNTLSDWRKSERRRQAILDRFAPTFASVTPPSTMVDKARLEQCLAHLAARDMTIVALTFYVELEGDEIARELEMSPGNVRVARHRAMKQLLECMTRAA